MRTDLGLFDRLFGRKTTLEVPLPDGGSRTIRVTERWLKEMVRLGKISPVGGQRITTHILDPRAGMGALLGLPDEEVATLGQSTASEIYRVEQWVVGEDVPAELYNRFRDPETGDLYILVIYKDGEPSTNAVHPDVWRQAHAAMEDT
jgi:hypothetical protein